MTESEILDSKIDFEKLSSTLMQEWRERVLLPITAGMDSHLIAKIEEFGRENLDWLLGKTPFVRYYPSKILIRNIKEDFPNEDARKIRDVLSIAYREMFNRFFYLRDLESFNKQELFDFYRISVDRCPIERHHFFENKVF